MQTPSLSFRLFALLLASLILFIGANAWWLERSETHRMLLAAKAKAAFLLEALQKHRLSDGRIDANGIMQEIQVSKADPELVALVLVDATGQARAASRGERRDGQTAPGDFSLTLANWGASRHGLGPQQEFDAATHTLVAWTPLSVTEGGGLFLALDVSARQQAVWQQVAGQLLRETSIAAFCLILLFALLARWVVAPLGSIRRQVENFPAGEFRRIEVHGGAREIAEAVEVFNALQTEWNALRQRMLHATLAFEASREGITITDAAGRIEQVNPAFTAITGYSAEEAVGQTPRILQSGRQGPEFYAAMWRSIAEQGFWAGEIWNRRKNGQLWPEWLSISAACDEHGAVTHYVGVFTDLSEIKAAESRAEALAWNSALVGLPNRTFLLARLKEAVALVGNGERRGFALLLINLHGFQRLNASFGIEAGDVVLVETARRLQAATEGHLTCHMEGDEFAVFLNSDISQEEAARFASTVLHALEQPHVIEDRPVVLGAAIGIALCPGDGSSVSSLLRQADSALEAARRETDSQYRFASSELTERARARLDLENRLRQALAGNEMCVFFQSQIEVRHGRVIGAEALVRWRDPLHGLVPPDRFIQVAEDSGLIVELGRQVLFETCRQGAAWRAAGLPPLKLAVNVAARQWAAGNLVARWRQLWRRTAIRGAGWCSN